MLAAVAARPPQLRVAAVTLRTRALGEPQRLGGARLVGRGRPGREATQRDGLEILDRVGGGDSFASGLAYALLTGRDLAIAVEYGAAHGALAMTTPGDTSMATVARGREPWCAAGARASSGEPGLGAVIAKTSHV